LEGYSGPMCNKHVHSTMTRSSRFHCLIGVINKPTTDRVVYITCIPTTCRNCSRDPDHAHLGNTHQKTKTSRIQNLKSLGSPVTKLGMVVQNAENGMVWGSYGSLKVMVNATIR